MPQLRIYLLGPPRIELNGHPLTFNRRKVLALLVYLAASQRAHQRDHLATLLYPGYDQSSARTNLRKTVSLLNQQLHKETFDIQRDQIAPVRGEAGRTIPFAQADRHTIQIHPEADYKADVQQFADLVERDPAQAIALYRGDFLADFYLPDSEPFEEWANGRRAHYQRQVLNALDEVTAVHLQDGRFDAAETLARKQLNIDNLRESGHRQLMEALARDGRRRAALSHYETLSQLLQDELGIAPSSETEVLVEAIRGDSVGGETEGEGREVSGDKPEPVPHNLPTQTTPFIGRKAELAGLDDLLSAPQTRLVTIVGAGGMGKTRLSLAVAERQLVKQQFPQGVFFVPLMGLGESDRIVSAVAEAINLRLEKGEVQLLNYLRSKRVLLVLDNFEHLLDGSDLVGRLLQAAPQMQILVTSRERLRLHREQVYPIQGLVVDETAVADDARTLFLQAARRLRPDFEVNAENLPTVNQICRLVEGMPLALELAAAWIDMLTPAEIAAEIQRNVDFLTTDLRDVPSRHRSMQAVFAASWQRLSANEQRLLAEVTVFKGGFTREAVTAVTKASLRDLAALVNKSLLTFDTAYGRYHMHELLRQYAAVHREEDAPLRKRHSAYYCSWLAAWLDTLTGPEQLAVTRKVQADMPNIRAAIFHTLKQAQIAVLETALPALAEYYYACGQYNEGINLFQQIHDGLSGQSDQAPFALFWTSIRLASFHGILFQAALAEPFLHQAKGLLETPEFLQRDTQAERAFLHYVEGYRLFEQEPESAVQLFRRSQTLFEQLGNRVWLVRNMIGLARAIRNTGDLDLAPEVATRSFSLAQASGNPLLQVETQLLLGQLNYRVGKYAEAEAQLQLGIALVRQLNHPQLLGLGLIYLGYAHMFNGRFEAILQSSQECQQISADLGNLQHQVQGQILEAFGRLHLGQYKRCAALVQEARSLTQIATETMNDFVYGIPFQFSSRLALVEGDLVEARTQLLAGQKFLRKSAFGLVLGLVIALEGDVAMAWQTIIPELQFESKQKAPQLLAQLLAVAAYLYALEGKEEQAVSLYAVVRQYPFIDKSQWYEDVIGKRITAASTNLSPDVITAAQARGKEMDMWQTAETLLNPLKS